MILGSPTNCGVAGVLERFVHGAVGIAALGIFCACSASRAPTPLVSTEASARLSSTRDPASPQGERSLAARIDPIFASFDEPNSPGCAVGVYRAGEIIYARGYGMANLEDSIPNTRTTPFQIASLSKHFTAAAVALLAREGRLSLDDDVRKFVPELPDYGNRITLRHLVHHTSGLREFTALLDLEGFGNDDQTNDDDALFILTRQRALNFQPGAEYSYINSGYFLLSLAIKRVTGKSLAQFAKERLFEPLGMHDTRFVDDHTLVIPHRAIGYARNEDGSFGVAMSNCEQVGADGLVTTIEDLARWDANFYAPKVGDQTFIELLRQRGKLNNGKTLTYAMGLIIDEVGGVPRERHEGARHGFRSSLVRFPTERLGVAVLCNQWDVEPWTLADRVATVFLAQPPASGTAPATPTQSQPSHVDAAAFAPFAGTYVLQTTLENRTLELKDGKLFLLKGDVSLAATPIDAHSFVTKGTRYTVEPASGHTPARLVRFPREGEPQTLERVEPFVPDAKALQEYVGRYGTEEIPRDVEIILLEGKLYTRRWGRTPDRKALEPVVRDGFLGDGETFHFERDSRGRVTGFLRNSENVRLMKWLRR
jgi:CubicO group peptidase (beta-lactamase class C family)